MAEAKTVVVSPCTSMAAGFSLWHQRSQPKSPGRSGRPAIDRLHQVQIKFRANPKHAQRLIQHLAVLCGRQKDGFNSLAPLKLKIERRHFDALSRVPATTATRFFIGLLEDLTKD